MPMYKKIPNSTDIGIFFSTGDAKIDNPVINETKKPDKRCSLISAIFGESPGAWFLRWKKGLAKKTSEFAGMFSR